VVIFCHLLTECKIYRINKEKNEVLSDQASVFRINCVDCLDRTNVVQAAIAKTMLEIMVWLFLCISLFKTESYFLVKKNWFIRFG
jgi:hypothetical protein